VRGVGRRRIGKGRETGQCTSLYRRAKAEENVCVCSFPKNSERGASESLKGGGVGREVTEKR